MLPADSPFVRPAAPGPHPAPAELRAYTEGRLAPGEEHRIEAHTLDCERCADLITGFSMTDAATTDHAVAALRTRLQARVGNTEPVAVPTVRRAWPRIAAAVALLAAAAGGFWTLDQYAVSEAPVAVQQASTPPSRPPSPAASSATEPVREAETAVSPVQPSDTSPAYAAARVSRPSRPGGARPMRRTSPVLRRAAPSSAAAVPAAVEAGDASVPVAASPVALPARAEADLAVNTETSRLSEEAESAVTPSKAKAAMAVAPEPSRMTAARMPAPLAINPAPVGGRAALRDYIRREVVDFVPETTQRAMTGTVRVKFVVEANGTLSNLRVARGMGPPYDAEAIRIVCEGPAWQPGISEGRRAPLPVEIDVSF